MKLSFIHLLLTIVISAGTSFFATRLVLKEGSAKPINEKPDVPINANTPPAQIDTSAHIQEQNQRIQNLENAVKNLGAAFQANISQKHSAWGIYDFEIEYNLLKIINEFSISNDDARKIIIDGKKLSFNVAKTIEDPNLNPEQKKKKLRQLFDAADQYSKSFIAPEKHTQYTKIMEDARVELFR